MSTIKKHIPVIFAVAAFMLMSIIIIVSIQSSSNNMYDKQHDSTVYSYVKVYKDSTSILKIKNCTVDYKDNCIILTSQTGRMYKFYGDDISVVAYTKPSAENTDESDESADLSEPVPSIIEETTPESSVSSSSAAEPSDRGTSRVESSGYASQPSVASQSSINSQPSRSSQSSTTSSRYTSR